MDRTPNVTFAIREVVAAWTVGAVGTLREWWAGLNKERLEEVPRQIPLRGGSGVVVRAPPPAHFTSISVV